MDHCVFNKMVDGVQLTVGVYVDDLLTTCANLAALDQFLDDLRKTYKEITVHEGEVLSYVGMTLDYSTPGYVYISMVGYTQDILQLYDVKGFAATPACAHLFDHDEASPALPEKLRQLFHSATAKLLYLTKRTRPELLPLISVLSSRVTIATEQDMQKLRRGLNYLNSNPDMGIKLTCRPDHRVQAYIDASFAVHPDMKSHTGVCISIGGGPIYVESSKQRLVSRSSTEAELIALSDGLTLVIWTREWLLQQGYDPVPPAIVYQDNLSTKALAENGRSQAKRTRHINIKYFFVFDRIQSLEVQIVYLPTEDMIADILSKPVLGRLFQKLLPLLLAGSGPEEGKETEL
jgi:hypothetical protein